VAATASVQSEILATEAGAGMRQAPDEGRRGFKRFLPRWFLTLIGTKLSLLGFVMFVFMVLVALLAPVITGGKDPAVIPSSNYQHLLGLAPSWSHPFGTNDAGQDIFVQTVWGSRMTLAVGAMSGIAITVLAVLVGMLAGYLGGWIDDFLSMVMNIFLILPQLPLLIVISAYTNFAGSSALISALVMTSVITVTGWAWGGRVMRAQTLSLRSRDFVDAARVTGESTFHIVFHDMLPNMLALIVNTIIMSCFGGIVTETTLDYLGVGGMSQVTWGTILNKAEGQSVLYSHEWWCFVFPGLAVAITILSLIFMNNGVDALANPRLRRIKRPRVRKAQNQPELELMPTGGADQLLLGQSQ